MSEVVYPGVDGWVQVEQGVAYPGADAWIQLVRGATYPGASAWVELEGHAQKMTYGTSFPASPADGDLHVLVDSTSTPGYSWLFRYNAGSTSPYKWECVGGVPYTANVDTGETTNSTSYVALATAGPSITVPRTGTYIVGLGYSFTVTGGAGGGLMSYLKGATAAADADACQCAITTASLPGGSWREFKRDFSAGDVLAARYKVSGNTGNFSQRVLGIVPIRCS